MPAKITEPLSPTCLEVKKMLLVSREVDPLIRSLVDPLKIDQEPPGQYKSLKSYDYVPMISRTTD